MQWILVKRTHDDDYSELFTKDFRYQAKRNKMPYLSTESRTFVYIYESERNKAPENSVSIWSKK